jgi:anaerobic selenocysteine-containing dehydrogenase
MSARPSILQFREFDGPLTRDLVQRPGQFGLGNVPQRLTPDDVRTSVCGFCSTGCGLKVHLKDGAAVNLTADPSYPVNLGMACPKGWEALTPLAAPDRATVPLMRDPVSGRLEPSDWDTALQTFVLKFRAIIDQHGPDSVAWIGTGQMPNEELAFLGALAKFGLGFVHGDGNTRQCMATAVAAYKECFGFDAPPYTYEDFEESDVILLIGSNLCIAHPILWQRVLMNRRNAKIIVIDPRRTETAVAAHEHIPLKPKGDLVFFYAVANELIANQWIDQRYIDAHTTGYPEFAAHVGAWTPERAAPVCGVDPSVIRELARTIHEGKAVSFWWTMGVNQGHESTRTAQAIIALALMTGNIGRPGTGANSITGQCNAMGSRLFSNTTNLLGGHDFTNAAHRGKVAGVLGIDPARVPSRNSLAYDQIMERVASGEIKGLWIIATNTAHSWIGNGSVPDALAKLDFLVVQDMYHTTETARRAHLVLPAAGWGEKDGTFINSERRIGLMRAVSRAPGEALSDFRILRLIAHYAGCHSLFSRWTSPEAVFSILQELSAGQPCDITGIRGYDMLEENGGMQWPVPAGGTESAISTGAMSTPRVPSHRRLFEDGKFFTADGRARFVSGEPREPAEPVDESHPLILMTGRGTSAQWHTGTRTGKSAILQRMHPSDLTVEVHPDNAAPLGLTTGMWVTVSSRRGSVRAKALVTSAVPAGAVFLPMHHPAVNVLTLPSFDPHSRQPSYKHCAVRLTAHPSATP